MSRRALPYVVSAEKSVEAAMYDDDHDALAAEYVLGTLSAAEREQAEALLARDAGFAETVRLWEHRLGELNVMVEAVEPPPDLWERIKTGIDGAERRSQAASETIELTGLEPVEAAASAASPQVDASAEPSVQTVPDLLSEQTQSSEDAKTAGLASTLLASESTAEFVDRLPKSTALQPTPGTETAPPDQSAGRWRGLAIGASAIAALLAAYIAVTHLAPGLISVGRQPQIITGALKPAAVPQLVAVLQQEPTAPAFLVMLDPQQRTLTIRRLTAAPDSGRSYELWLNSNKLPNPASLGPVGNSEVTTRSIPQNIDAETMRSATYSVSLEPSGGSATGAPTGPTLFRGRMIETVSGSSG
jgi:anti-sigma-K factor RskA